MSPNATAARRSESWPKLMTFAFIPQIALAEDLSCESAWNKLQKIADTFPCYLGFGIMFFVFLVLSNMMVESLRQNLGVNDRVVGSSEILVRFFTWQQKHRKPCPWKSSPTFAVVTKNWSLPLRIFRLFQTKTVPQQIHYWKLNMTCRKKNLGKISWLKLQPVELDSIHDFLLFITWILDTVDGSEIPHTTCKCIKPCK